MVCAAAFRLLVIAVRPGRVHPRRIGLSYLACQPFKAVVRAHEGVKPRKSSVYKVRCIKGDFFRAYRAVFLPPGAEP